MAFRKKAEYILPYKPDILIVPECEHTDKLLFNENINKPTEKIWFGSNHKKGVGIFSYSNFRFALSSAYNPNFKFVIPLLVTGGKMDFMLYAVWANNPDDQDGRYVEQTWKAIKYYEHLLSEGNSIIAGDFNSNTIWDKKRKEATHSNLVKKLEGIGIYSAYHLYHKQIQGKEAHPTLFMYRHIDKPYHIDYCFVSKKLKRKLISVEIGEYSNWIKYSDHVPVIATFKI